MLSIILPRSIYQIVDSVNRRENPKFIFFSVFLFVSLVLQSASVAYAVDCEPGKRGTFNPTTGQFVVSSSGSDYRLECSGDTSNEVNIDESIADAVNQGDVVPDALRYIVIDMVGNASDTNINLNLTHDPGEPPFGELPEDADTIVILGDITTTTQDSNGIGIGSHDGNYNATPITTLIVESWADITTSGVAARGVTIYNDAGEAGSRIVFINHGEIETRGDGFTDDTKMYSSRRARAIAFGTLDGDAEVVNESDGVVKTSGTGARGIQVDVENMGTAKVTNRGSVTTTGGGFSPTNNRNPIVSGADGVTATSELGDAEGTNEGTIDTTGDGARGMRIASNGTGTATATNSGSVTTRGDEFMGRNADGVTAWSGSGNVKVVNSGDVMVTGSRSVGLKVTTSGTGNAEVEMTDGSSVTAGTNGTKFGIGIQAITTNDDDGDDVDVEIDVTGSEITAYSANQDDTSTTDFDESSGIGIFADAGSDVNGRIVTRIDRSTITADTAMKFVDGRTLLEMEFSTVTGDIEFDVNGDTAVATSDINLIGSKDVNDRMKVTHSIITGDVNFGPGNDLLEVIGIRNNTDEILSEFDGNLNMGEGDDTITVNFAGGKFLGDIDFGENPNDDDRLILDVAARNTLLFEGEIRNLEYMNKRCPGIAIVGDVIFSGSTVDIEEGQLLLTGHLNVGDGDVTIHDQALLAFEVGDIATDRNDHGSITARGGIKFMEDASQVVDIQIRHDLTETVADGVREELNVNGIDVLEAQTNFVDSVGSPITEVMVTSNGEMTENMIGSDITVFTDTEAIAQNEDPIVEVASPSPPLPASSARGGGGSGGGLIFGLGLVAYLMSNWMDEGFGAFVDYEEENLGLSNINVSSATSFLPGIGEERRFQIGNSEHWIRSYAGQSPASVAGAQTNASGTAYGINTKLRNGFDLGVSFTPRLKSSTQGLDSNFYSSSSSGELYEVQVGWQSSQFFSKLQLSHGDYDVDSVVANPVVNSALRGSFNMTNTHAQFTGGAKLEFGGVRVAPSASLFGGSLEQASHSAEGPVMRADVPEISQRYSGWKLGMNLTSSDWLKNSGNLSWRPSLHFSTMQTNTSGPSSLSVMQSDRAGALSFANQADVRGMPGVVHALGVNTIIKQSKNSRFNVGYFGTEVDGERDHAVLARYQFRF